MLSPGMEATPGSTRSGESQTIPVLS